MSLTFSKLSSVTFLLVGLFFSTIASSDELWQFDVDAARKQAKNTSRLIVLVQFDFDFLKPIQGTEEIENYEHHCCNPEVRQWIAENAVLVAQPVGHPQIIGVESKKARNPKAPKVTQVVEPEKPKSIGNCVTWFCNSEGTVWGVIAGYPEPADFLAQGRSIVASLVNLGAAPLPSAISAWHLARVMPEDQAVYRRYLRTSKSKNDQIRRSQKIEFSAMAAANSRKKRLQERFGARWNPALLVRFASFENQFYQMLLADIPDAEIEELQRPVWQYLSGNRMWYADQSKLIDWIETQRVNQLPILLQIQGGSDNSKWPPSNRPRLNELVDQFEIWENATVDDVAVVSNYIGTKKLLIPINRAPTFFVATSHGDEYKLCTTADGDSDVTKIMEQINTLETKRR